MTKLLEQFSSHPREDLEKLNGELDARSIGLLMPADDAYPDRLTDLRRPPAYLFFWGNLSLLEERGVGMCGSRNVSQRGLEAARACGEEVAREGWHVVSGYAKGVDTETHLASLSAGAGTVIVLAEGILNFRKKRIFETVPFDPERVLVLSQFHPRQRWSAGAAMARNGVIAALGESLLVIEAGEKGGTLNAGIQGLELGRQVLVLQFSAEMPAGNQILLNEGAKAVGSRGALKERLSELSAQPTVRPQMNLWDSET